MQMTATTKPYQQAARRSDQVAAEAQPHMVFTRHVEPKELPKSARYAPLARMVAFQQSPQGKQVQEEVTQEGLKIADAAAEHYRESHIFESKRCSTVEELRFLCEMTGNWLSPLVVELRTHYTPVPDHIELSIRNLPFRLEALLAVLDVQVSGHCAQ